MKRAVITGAGGFIGRNLTKRLVQENVQVYGIDVEVAQEHILSGDGITPLFVDIGVLPFGLGWSQYGCQK